MTLFSLVSSKFQKLSIVRSIAKLRFYKTTLSIERICYAHENNYLFSAFVMLSVFSQHFISLFFDTISNQNFSLLSLLYVAQFCYTVPFFWNHSVISFSSFTKKNVFWWKEISVDGTSKYAQLHGSHSCWRYFSSSLTFGLVLVLCGRTFLFFSFRK